MIVGGCLVGILMVALWPGEREPEYKGKTLSQLVTMGWKNGRWVGTKQEGREVIEGTAHVGTNALPWLVKWIGEEEVPWQMMVWGNITKLPAMLRVPVYKRFGDPLLRDARGPSWSIGSILVHETWFASGARRAPVDPVDERPQVERRSQKRGDAGIVLHRKRGSAGTPRDGG